MVVRNIGDNGNQGSDDVCTIEEAAESDLKDDEVRFGIRKIEEAIASQFKERKRFEARFFQERVFERIRFPILSNSLSE